MKFWSSSFHKRQKKEALHRGASYYSFDFNEFHNTGLVQHRYNV